MFCAQLFPVAPSNGALAYKRPIEDASSTDMLWHILENVSKYGRILAPPCRGDRMVSILLTTDPLLAVTLLTRVSAPDGFLQSAVAHFSAKVSET